MLQNGSERPWEAKRLSVKGLLPFRFRYATVHSADEGQTGVVFIGTRAQRALIFDRTDDHSVIISVIIP
jgi:hypothetical protein